jgi:hypothetical protein
VHFGDGVAEEDSSLTRSDFLEIILMRRIKAPGIRIKRRCPICH